MDLNIFLFFFSQPLFETRLIYIYIYIVTRSIAVSHAATERRDNLLDRNDEPYNKNFSTAENTWCEEQPIDETHCRLLNSEYGQVLFERDLARRHLRVANYGRGEELQLQTNKKCHGMYL